MFDLLSLLADVALLVLLVACAASLVVRSRRSDDVRRRQVKWLALAGLGVPGFIVVCLTEVIVLGQPRWLSLAIGIATAVGVPVAAAIAMLRHDLYDIDR
ncbi:MAG TPA: hypothetical protein VFI83_05390, partial [Gaiella sp.]|nr:hypothetical protein [Gaiella sp.]